MSDTSYMRYNKKLISQIELGRNEHYLIFEILGITSDLIFWPF